MNEFEIQSLIEYTFRRNGADRPSFSTIVGSGPNSTTLHYNADDRFMNAGEVVVMDIGASYRGYAADVTRTVPINGTFTPDQRAIYQIVRDAQAAAERQAKLGAKAQLMSDSASAVLAAGLARLGLIESPTATYDCGAPQQPQQCRSSSSTTCTASDTASASRCTTPTSSTSRARSRPAARSRSSRGSTCARTARDPPKTPAQRRADREASPGGREVPEHRRSHRGRLRRDADRASSGSRARRARSPKWRR